jgi:hypothetical protein
VNSARFKAEISFEGQIVTERYLERISINTVLLEIKKVETPEQCRQFMLKHGAGIVDAVGKEVDRIEQTIQRIAPEVRHVDLEVL